MAGQFSAHARASSRSLSVPVRALGLGVDHRPVGDVREQQVDAVVELFGRLDGIGGDQSLLVALALHVPALDGVAAAEGHEGPAVQHPAAEVVVLIDDQHAGPEVPRADGRGQARAPAPRDDDVHLVVPDDVVGRSRGLRLRLVGGQQRARPQPGRGSRPDEVPPADTLLVLGPRLVAVTDLLRHLQPPLSNRLRALPAIVAALLRSTSIGFWPAPRSARPMRPYTGMSNSAAALPPRMAARSASLSPGVSRT